MKSIQKKDILELIKNPLFISFSTVDGQGFPETRVVVNLRNNNIASHLTDFFGQNDKIYIMTNSSSAKISDISDNSKTSLYISDNDRFTGLLLMGETIELMDNNIKKSLWMTAGIFTIKMGLIGETSAS